MCPVNIYRGMIQDAGARVDEMTRPAEASFVTGHVYSQPDWELQGYSNDSFRSDIWGGWYAQAYIHYPAGLGSDSSDQARWTVTYWGDGITDRLFHIDITYRYN